MGLRDAWTWVCEDVRMQGRGDAETLGRGDVGRGNVGTRRRAGTRGRDKQTTADFCAKFVNFRSSVR